MGRGAPDTWRNSPSTDDRTTEGREATMPKDGDEPAPPELMDWQKKQKEFELVKARAKELRLRLTCTICGEKAKLNCPCGTTQCAPARVGGGARS